tara:strand:+ start:56 stop:313 length:258 start_codon:yes stop_codon:yes gene_type:complete
MSNKLNDLVYIQLCSLDDHNIYTLPDHKCESYHDILKSNKKYGKNKFYGINKEAGEQFYIMQNDKVLFVGCLESIYFFLRNKTES